MPPVWTRPEKERLLREFSSLIHETMPAVKQTAEAAVRTATEAKEAAEKAETAAHEALQAAARVEGAASQILPAARAINEAYRSQNGKHGGYGKPNGNGSLISQAGALRGALLIAASGLAIGLAAGVPIYLYVLGRQGVVLPLFG